MLFLAMTFFDDESDFVLFEKIELKYRDIMYKEAYSLLEDSHLAEDAVADTFLSLASYFDKFVRIPEYEQLAYLRVCVRNQAYRYLKKYKKISKFEFSGEDVDEISLEEDPVFDEVNRNEMVKAAAEALNSMPDIYRDVLHMRYVEDLKISEIARLMKCSEGTIKARISRAKKLFFKTYKEKEGSYEL